MGISDLALGIEVLNAVVARGGGRPIAPPQRVTPRLRTDITSRV
jgi:hypothetical protein